MPKNPYTNDVLTPIELRQVFIELHRRLAYVPDAILMFQKARFRLDVFETRLRPILRKKAMEAYCQTLPTVEIVSYVSTFFRGHRMTVCRRCVDGKKHVLFAWICEYLLFCNHSNAVTYGQLLEQLQATCQRNRIASHMGDVPYCPMHYRRYRPKRDLPSLTPGQSIVVEPFNDSPFRFTSEPSSDTRPLIRRKRPKIRNRPTHPSRAAPVRRALSASVPPLDISAVLRLLRTSIVPTQRQSPLLLLLEMGESMRESEMDNHDGSYSSTITIQDPSSESSSDEANALYEILGSLFEDE